MCNRGRFKEKLAGNAEGDKNMGFFKKQEKISRIEFNKDRQRAVIKCSICNGEQVAGFKDKETGNFTEVMLIRNAKDLNQFMEMYELCDVTKEY